MKDHMMNAGSKFTDPNELAHKLDEYELIRKGHKKQWIKGSDKKDRESKKNFDSTRNHSKIRFQIGGRKITMKKIRKGQDL